MSSKRNDKASKERRRLAAQERLEQNEVVNCFCGSRHYKGWPGCKLKRGAA